MTAATSRSGPAHPYRAAARPPEPPPPPRALPEGLSQIERAKLGLVEPHIQFWLLVASLVLAFGVVNALADVVFRVLV
ncbi:MAG: hypothetical protein JNK04_16780 [Myxococcales bacterium]|nr:hypothetical protein [Myxococcales bacterium]